MSEYMPKFYTLEDMTQEDLNKLALERNSFASEIERLNSIIKEAREYIEEHREYYYESVFDHSAGKQFTDKFDEESSTKELLDILKVRDKE